MSNKILNQGNHATFVRKAMSSFAFLHDRAIIFHDNLLYNHKPDLCNCILATCLAGIIDQEDNAQTILKEIGMQDLIELAAALIWIHTDGAYVFDATLQAELLKLPVDEHIPILDLGQTQEPCVYIQVPITIENQNAYGFFAWLEYAFKDESCLNAVMIFAFFMMDGTIVPRYYCLKDQCNIVIDQFAHNESIKRLSEDINRSIRQEVKPLPKALWPLINLVMYLGVEQADIDKLVNEQDDNNTYGPPNIWKVGYRIGNAFRKYDNASIENGSLKNAKPRPYIRNAHWHTYWTGSKCSKSRCRVLQWIPFTPIGLDWKNEEKDIVHILK